MQIHIQRGDQNLGAFSLEETSQYLARGNLLETDLAWHEGLNDWAPLGGLIRQFGETKPTLGSDKPSPKVKEEEPAIFGQGRYQREKVLGKGGQGEVWLAQDLQLERQVAIKQVSAQCAPGTMAYQSLKDEVQKSLELTHPNITRIYDLVDVPGESPFISMEYLEGEDLHVKMRKREGGHFSWGEIEPYILNLCDALEYAHGQGMVHRDLKPANLIITDSGELKLTDMGIAEPAKDSEDLLGQADYVSGTPHYWSPQQSQGITPQATDDIYSLGATLYHLLTGRPPFLGDNAEEITKQHLAKTPDDLQQVLKAEGHATQIPAHINQLVLKCLAKDPASRPQGTGYIRDWIKAKGDPAVKKQKRMVLAAGVMGVVALAMGGLAIWAWTQRTEAEEQRGIAETKQQQAETAQEKEAKQREEAEKQREIAETKQKEAEQQNYFNVIAGAQSKIDAGQFDQAKEVLWATPKEMRNWEWGHLMQLCHSEILTLKMPGHGYPLAFSSDGIRVVVGNKIWDAETGKEHLTLKGLGPLKVSSAAFSSDGKRVITGIRKAQEFSPDGKRVFPGSLKHSAKIWDAETGKELLILNGLGNQRGPSVAFSPDGKRVVAGFNEGPTPNKIDGIAKIWDAETGQELQTLKGHVHSVNSVAFSPNGKRLVTGNKIWDAETGQELLTLKGHASPVNSAAFSPDGQRVVTVSGDKTAKIWDALTGKELLTLKGHEHLVSSSAFSPDGRRVVTGSEDRTAKIWDAETGQELLTLKGHASWVGSVAFSPDGKRVVTSGGDKTVKIWDAEIGAELLLLKGHAGFVKSAAFSPDGKRVVTGRRDKTAKIWDAANGKELLTLKGHGHDITSVAFSPDGRRVVTGSWDSTAKIWNAETGKEFLTFKGHGNQVAGIAVSPDGKRVVSGSQDKTAKIWDATDGTELVTLNGHGAWVYSVAFSPDGKRVVSGSADKTAKIWDAETGQELLTLMGYKNSVPSVGFSPDGKRVVTGGGYGTARIWNTIDWSITKEEFPQYQLKRYQAWLKRNEAKK